MIVAERFHIASPVRSLLIIQLGDIGDVVWTLPTLQSLHQAYPDGKISVMVREGIGALLAAEPYLHKVFEVRSYEGGPLEKGKQQLQFIRCLRNERFDWAVDLRSGDRGAFAAWLTGATVRASLFHEDVPFWRNHLFTHLVRPAAGKVRTAYGAAEQSLRIVRGLGVPVRTDIPVLQVSAQALASAKRLLAPLDPVWQNESVLKETMVTLNPFSRWSYKEWDSQKWVTVVDWLSAEFNVKTVIVGSPAERSKAASLINQCSGRVYNMAGETTLDTLAALLSLGRLHIGVDSAAPHMAAAVGTPTVTIYGPSDWRDWAPVGDQHRVVSSDMDCAPCHQKGCDGQGYSRCLDQLSVETVKKAIMSAALPHRGA